MACSLLSRTAFLLALASAANAFTAVPNGGRGALTNAAVSPQRTWSPLQARTFYDDFGEEEDDDEYDDDEEIDPDSLGDWRAFRRNLAATLPTSEEAEEEESVPKTTASEENQEVLLTQNKQLGEEYKNDVWAHEVATPEVGGLIVRMPLEVELYRNHRHSIVGRKLRVTHGEKVDLHDTSLWYDKAKKMVEEEMLQIAESAGDGGQIDATELSDEATEMLQLYLDSQETWQEVCLVLEKADDEGWAKTLVLNRPMALKLTEHLAQLVLNGAFTKTIPTVAQSTVEVDLVKFMLAFGNECAVYVGGTDKQDHPAIMIHGIADLPGATEISRGSGIYRGGLKAAVDGVIDGKYNPLDFRFFVGCHEYDESTLDVSVVLGKYQPVASARSIAIKQCISLPKPLWHEVLELCGGHMAEISALEMGKNDGITFQVVDEGDADMLDELGSLEDEDDFYDD